MSGLYVKLSTTFADDPKVIEAGPLAELVHVRAVLFLARCGNGNEFLSYGQLDRCTAGIMHARRHAARLVDAGLWQTVPGGWRIVRWTDADALRELKRRRWAVYQRRHEVFARDGWRCVECGATERLEVDHIVPISRGGSDDDDNLQTLCKPCNSGKRDRI